MVSFNWYSKLHSVLCLNYQGRVHRSDVNSPIRLNIKVMRKFMPFSTADLFQRDPVKAKRFSKSLGHEKTGCFNLVCSLDDDFWFYTVIQKTVVAFLLN